MKAVNEVVVVLASMLHKLLPPLDLELIRDLGRGRTNFPDLQRPMEAAHRCAKEDVGPSKSPVNKKCL